MDAGHSGRVLTFVTDEPFDVSLRTLRRALASEGLRVAHGLDTTARVRQELGVGLKQHMVLYVDDPILLLEATVMNAAGGLFVPEPVVLASERSGCVVYLRRLEPRFDSDLPLTVRTAVFELHERIVAAVQRIAIKETAVTQMAEQGMASRFLE
jgi:hypothetical protein